MRSVLLATLLLAVQARGGALQDAIKAGDNAALERLLKTGARVNVHDAVGATPLHDAAWAGNTDAVRLLLDHGAQVNTRHTGETGSTPLDYAVQTSSAEVVKLLLARGAQVNLNFSLHAAASRGDLEITTILIAAGAPVNRPNKAGSTPLHQAAAKGNIAVMELLLAHAADTAKADFSGLIPIESAAQSGQTAAVRLLLQKGPAVPPERMTALSGKAVMQGDTALVQVLISNHSVASLNGLLHDAALKGYREIAAQLLQHGANVNARNKYGATPLHDAALTGHTDLLELLLANGAEVNAHETDSGATALYSAASMGHADAAALLLAHAADPNATNKSGHGPLYAATENHFPQVAEYLISHGATSPGPGIENRVP